MSISKKTLRRYCHFNEIKLNPHAVAISEWYDSHLSVKVNLQYAKENGIKTSRTSLYNYCKSNGINPKGMEG